MRRHAVELDGHTLTDLERACAQLRLLGASGTTEVRLRVTLSMSPDGGLPKTVTGRWTTDPDSLAD